MSYLIDRQMWERKLKYVNKNDRENAMMFAIEYSRFADDFYYPNYVVALGVVEAESAVGAAERLRVKILKEDEGGRVVIDHPELAFRLERGMAEVWLRPIPAVTSSLTEWMDGAGMPLKSEEWFAYLESIADMEAEEERLRNDAAAAREKWEAEYEAVQSELES